jgi:hypothetical protein
MKLKKGKLTEQFGVKVEDGRKKIFVLA